MILFSNKSQRLAGNPTSDFTLFASFYKGSLKQMGTF